MELAHRRVMVQIIIMSLLMVYEAYEAGRRIQKKKSLTLIGRLKKRSRTSAGKMDVCAIPSDNAGSRMQIAVLLDKVRYQQEVEICASKTGRRISFVRSG